MAGVVTEVVTPVAEGVTPVAEVTEAAAQEVASCPMKARSAEVAADEAQMPGWEEAVVGPAGRAGGRKTPQTLWHGPSIPRFRGGKQQGPQGLMGPDPPWGPSPWALPWGPSPPT